MTIRAELQGAVARAFPGRRDLAVSGLREISEGWECQVFAFDLASVDGGDAREDALILRIYQGSGAATKCADECTALRALGPAGFPVPALFHQEIEPGIEGRPFIIMERIGGRTLGDLFDEAAESERVEMLRRFTRLFAELHHLEWRPHVPNVAELEERDSIGRWLRMARRVTGEFGITEVDPVLVWLEERKSQIRPVPPSVTHNDFHPWNILCPSPGEMMVIDWTGAEVQDYRFDLAWTLLLATASLGGDWRDRLLAEYEMARGAPVEDLEFFEVIAALRRTGDIVISLRHGAEAMGMRAGAEEMMTGGNRHLQAALRLLRERSGLELSALETMG